MKGHVVSGAEAGTGSYVVHPAIVAIFVAGLVLPPLYLFAMVQYGAIIFPFWDHLETARHIIQYFDGTLTFHNLIEPQNQARPFFPRLIFIANAAMTNWDVRSEFVFIYLTVYGTLATLLWALWSISKTWPKLPILISGALISILVCSPAGANNYYWSLMLIATLPYLCGTTAMLIVSLHPLSKSANIGAAVLAWISAYSISNGLFLFPVILVLHQLLIPNRWTPSRWSLFWLANLVACYATYMPGISTAETLHSTLRNFLVFIPVYVGNPFGTLLWFEGAIQHKHTIVINGICGIAILLITAVTAWRAGREAPTRRPETLIFLCFVAFAGACTLVTAWGRANGDFPIASANSSRYSIFAAYYLLGLIFYYAPKFARREIAFGLPHKVFLGLFLIVATVSYVRGVAVYKSTAGYNKWLAAIYLPRGAPTADDLRAFPNLAYFVAQRAHLLRLGLGPYKSIPEVSVPIFSGSFAAGVPLTAGCAIVQRFKLERPVIRSLSFQIVTWGAKPSLNVVRWRVIGQKNGNPVPLGDGSFSTAGLTDWKTVTIKLNGSEVAEEADAEFYIEGGDFEKPVGLALFPPGKSSIPALVNGIAAQDGLEVALTVNYEK